jgi:acyl dehydratase
VTVDYATLREGDELPPFECAPGLPQVVRYCALNWNFPVVFLDAEAARAAGLPGTIVPGPLKLGLIYRALDEWLGDSGYIRQVRAAHRRPDPTGRPLVVTGRVVRVFEEDGARRADIEIVIVNEHGDPSVRGFASVQFDR